MKFLWPLLLLLVSTTTSADWLRIKGADNNAAEKFIETTSIRQTGPMNTMRRVWEMSNFAKFTADKALSIKTLMEYDCKDRRIRVLEENYFSEHLAKGEALTQVGNAVLPSNWSGIDKGSTVETIFYRLCPQDNG